MKGSKSGRWRREIGEGLKPFLLRLVRRSKKDTEIRRWLGMGMRVA